MILQAHNGPITVGYAYYQESGWFSRSGYRVTLPPLPYTERSLIVATKREVYNLFKAQGAKKIRKRTK